MRYTQEVDIVTAVSFTHFADVRCTMSHKYYILYIIIWNFRYYTLLYYMKYRKLLKYYNDDTKIYNILYTYTRMDIKNN